jgi:hypothetical protein
MGTRKAGFITKKESLKECAANLYLNPALMHGGYEL